MAIMSPIASIVDAFDLGPLTVERMGARVKNATFGYSAGAVVSITVDPVSYHNVIGRDLEQVPEADRNSEVVQFYARDASFPAGQLGFRVADGGSQADVILLDGRRYRFVTVRNFSDQGHVWCGMAALEDLQAQP